MDIVKFKSEIEAISLSNNDTTKFGDGFESAMNKVGKAIEEHLTLKPCKMENFKGTKGEWKTFPVSKNTPNELHICTKEGIGIACSYLGDGSTEELKLAEANAELIADAGNTIQKCGLLPSELLAQVEKLKKEKEELLNACKKSMKYSIGYEDRKVIEDAIMLTSKNA